MKKLLVFIVLVLVAGSYALTRVEEPTGLNVTSTINNESISLSTEKVQDLKKYVIKE